MSQEKTMLEQSYLVCRLFKEWQSRLDENITGLSTDYEVTHSHVEIAVEELWEMVEDGVEKENGGYFPNSLRPNC